MGDRKAPTPVPAGHQKPAAPPAPPEKAGLLLHRAAPIRGTGPAPIVITIDPLAPEFGGEGWQGRAEALYSSEARKLAEVLVSTLPGGTLDRLLIELLGRTASVLRVARG